MKYTNKIIEDILSQNSSSLGTDFHTYRNHVYRIYALCLKMDNAPQQEAKYAIAAAFHDLGIWTNQTFDYLKPSIDLAHQYLKDVDKTDWSEEIECMIDMHHKRSKYEGPYQQTVETFRRADWIDVTKGSKRFGLSKSVYLDMVKTFPLLGFHKFLIIQTIKHFFKSPFNPLPMFKK